MSTWTSRRRIVVVGIVIVLFVFLFRSILYLCIDPLNMRQFDSDVWKQASLEKIGNMQLNPRGPMTGDLVNNVLKLGISRQEVEELLGPPDHSFDGDKWGTVYNYYVGVNTRGAFLPSGDEVVLRFDCNDLLTEKTIVRND